MKRLLILLGLLSGCGEQHPVVEPAVEKAEQIMEKASCLSCHQQGNQMKLPTWQEIAKRYEGKNDAEAMLVSKIAKGGSGSWGKMDMPPYHPDLSEAERKAVIKNILSSSRN